MLRIVSTSSIGRFSHATQKVKPGTHLFISRPFVSVMYSRFSDTYCHNCFRKTLRNSLPFKHTLINNTISSSEQRLPLSVHRHCASLPKSPTFKFRLENYYEFHLFFQILPANYGIVSQLRTLSHISEVCQIHYSLVIL